MQNATTHLQGCTLITQRNEQERRHCVHALAVPNHRVVRAEGAQNAPELGGATRKVQRGGIPRKCARDVNADLVLHGAEARWQPLLHFATPQVVQLCQAAARQWHHTGRRQRMVPVVAQVWPLMLQWRRRIGGVGHTMVWHGVGVLADIGSMALLPTTTSPTEVSPPASTAILWHASPTTRALVQLEAGKQSVVVGTAQLSNGTTRNTHTHPNM